MKGTKQLALPEKVGHYRIDDRLGVGEMGMVYQGWDERLERPVALKQAIADDDAARESFRRSARAIAGLSHPSLIRIYDLIYTGAGDWIVMELIEGHALRTLLERGPLDPIKALPLAGQIAQGLAATHDRGIIFLTLRPRGILVAEDGQAKILDFGLARLLNSSQKDNPVLDSGAVRGAMRAMSPEQALDQPVDHRSDLFSFGTLLYEAITDRSPFQGATDVQTLQRLCSHRQDSAWRVNPKVPAELSELIDRLLEKDPQHRPQTAREVAETLREIEETQEPATGTVSLRLPPRDNASGTVGFFDAGLTDTQLISLKTLLVTDLVGSTQLVGDLGDARAAEILAQHDRLARDLISHFQGREIDKTDGFLVLFKRPVDSIRFALEYHHQLMELSAREGIELKARVGVHLGEVILHENSPRDVLRGAKPLEVQGLAKPIAARAMGLAEGGQTLLTRAAFDLVRRAMDEREIRGHKISWLSHGEYRFKGVDDGLPIFEVGLEGIAPLQPPVDTDKARRKNKERRAHAGGSPKTLLAAIAAALLLALTIYVFVPIDRSATAVQTRPSIAVLGFKNLSGRPEIAWLSTALSELFSTDLATGGELRLIPGEAIARMKLELSVPDADTLGTETLNAIANNLGTDYVLLGSYLPGGGGSVDELRLLLRLQDTREEENIFPLSDSGTETELFEMVSRTGKKLRQKLGVAELSAAEALSVKATLSADPQANRLYSEGLEKLRGFDAQAARDRLLQAVELEPTFALAHAALSEAWLALGYDPKAGDSAKQAFEASHDLPRAESLVIEARYWQAAGAWEKTVASYQDLWELSPGNVDYGVRLAEAQIGAGRGEDAQATLRRLRALPPPAGHDPRIDLAAAAAAASLSDYAGQLAAAERAMRKGQEHEAWILVAEARRRQWRALRNLGRASDARETLERARRLLEDAGDRGRLAQVLGGLAVLLEDDGKRSEAESLYRAALDIHRQIGNRKGVSEMLNSLADLILDRGELDTARAMVDDAIETAREIGDREKEAQYLDTRAWVLIHRGALAEAEIAARQARAIWREIGNREGVAWAQYYLGRIAFVTGDLKTSGDLLGQAFATADDIDNRYLAGFVLAGQGDVLLAADDLDAAMGKLAQAGQLRARLGDPAELAETQLTWIRLLLATDRTAEAEDLARRTMIELRNGESLDHEATAAGLLARILVARGQLAGAREALEPVREHAAKSQNPFARLSVALTVANLLAASRSYDTALTTLADIGAEAESLGLIGLELQARLDRGTVEIAAGASAPGTGHARCRALATEARGKDFELIARRAAARLATHDL